ncbi:MAG: ABC transporter ATP-binding protein [Nocardioidaceae bacterium]|nr:ABC transporter ATP-binding protein [Nocardioidaceae bacterium]MCL2614094.1 ABC transporter ATP-binding protein [Nocardioidaceae bacterium]
MTLELSGVSVDVGATDRTRAVDGVDLRLDDGRVLAVLGPSGCGKSTLLRAIAGLEPLAAGTIGWDGADLRAVPTHRRGFALMFQDGQLFDHLTVARNIAYPLRLRGDGRRRARATADDLLDLVGLQGYADRLPRTLSGGERQRVALARALAASPRLLLLDEPLSALDAGLRTRLAADLRRIITEAGTTALLVTHDHDEAFAVADRLAVMREGRVVQEGPTEEVWAAPVDVPTARFLGCTRVLTGPAARLLAGGDDGRVAVRPGALTAVPEGSDVADLAATVLVATASPDGARLVVAVEGIGELDAVARPGWSAAPGDRVGIVVAHTSLARLPEA